MGNVRPNSVSHSRGTTTLPNRETFIHIGDDLDDLWLRDTAVQIHPLLIPVLPSTHANLNSCHLFTMMPNWTVL